MTTRNFFEGTDIMKADVFTNNKTHWSPIRDKVEAWVKEGWARWEEEQPDWFTDHWKSIVPKDMKPAKKTGGVYRGDKIAAEYMKPAKKNKIAAENEGGYEALTVGGGDEQKGRRRNSILELISGQGPLPSKVMPVGVIEKELDEEHFMREMKRRGSFSM